MLHSDGVRCEGKDTHYNAVNDGSVTRLHGIAKNVFLLAGERCM